MEEHGISREYHGNSMGKWGLVITMWNLCASFTGNTWVPDCWLCMSGHEAPEMRVGLLCCGL